MRSPKPKSLPLLFAIVTVGLGSTDRATALELTASLAGPRVLQCEPVLVEVALRNDGTDHVLVVPPFIAPYGPSQPLALRVLVEGRDGVWAEPRIRGTETYWLAGCMRSEVRPFIHRLLPLDPGQAIAVWYSLNMVYALYEPGRYRLRVVYAPSPEMVAVADESARARAGDLWLGKLEVDLGTVEILAPPDEERAAAEFLLGRACACAPNPYAEPYAVRDVVAARWPTSVYLPYAEFYAMRTEARSGLHEGWHKPSGLEALRAEVAAFREAHSDFPLNHELDTIVARYAYGVAVRTAYPLDAHERLPKRSEVLALLQAGRELLETARRSGDYGLAAEMEATVGWTEWAYRKHIEAALAGRDPE